MLADTSSTPFLGLQQTKKHRKKISLYFSSCKAFRRLRMTKGRKTMSKTNESASTNLQRVLRFGRGETGEIEDMCALSPDSGEAET